MRSSKNFQIYLISTCAIILGFGIGTAQAQVSRLNQQTGVADPGRIGEQLREQMVLPQLSPDVQIKEAALLGAPEGAENIRFTLSNLTLEGNTVYSDEQLSTVYSDSVGQEISLTDLYRIANQITLKYRQDGYILTQVVVPVQTIKDGSARLQIVEGYINDISVEAEGEGNAALQTINAYASRIKGNVQALNIKDMERQLLLINDLPGVRARSIISPSESVPGAADMRIIIERDPFDAIVTLDNFGSRYLGPWSLGGVASLNSLFGLNEVITTQAVYAPGGGYELLYGGLGYEQPIGSLGTRIGFMTSVTDTDPGYDLKVFDVRGKSNLYSAYVSHPFIRSRNENLKGTLSFDWRDVRSSNNVERTRRDEIRALRAAVRYDFLDSLLGAAVNDVHFTISKGLNIFGASEEGDANMTRNLADPQFTKAELELQRLQRITNAVNLQLIARGQLASNALPSSEEIGVGGIHSGRGYDPSEIVGDHGVSGTVELQWNNPISPDGNVVQRYQLYTFMDAGRVWNEDATTNDDKRESLVSTGVGARVDFAYEVQAGVGVAFPLTRPVGSQRDRDRDPRLYLNLSKKF